MNENTSRPATLDDLKRIIKSLNENKADYFLIGGYALLAHGFYRTTTDIDIIVPASKDSGEKIIKALLVLADRSASKIELAWFEENETIRLADEIVVDIMFKAAQETYDSLKKYMEIIDLDGIPVKTIDIKGLLMTKKTPREKDLADLIILKEAIGE
jgi:hypothetical protein